LDSFALDGLIDADRGAAAAVSVSNTSSAVVTASVDVAAPPPFRLFIFFDTIVRRFMIIYFVGVFVCIITIANNIL